MTDMTIAEHRKLGEALEQNERFGGNDQIILAAARQTYDRWQECGECDDGQIAMVGHQPKGLGGAVVTQFTEDCSRCGGKGVRPNQAVLWCEVHDAEWCTFTGQGFENSDGCWRAAFDGGMARNGSSWVDDDCVQAVRAFDKEQDHE